MAKSKNSEKTGHNLSQRSLGAVVCILFTTLVIGINLLVNQLPVEKTKLDTTEIGLHTLSDSTKEVVLSISEDIDIYRICQPGKEDSTLTDMLERYASISPVLHISDIDPALYPDFEKQYTDEDLSDNSIIVSSSKRSQIIKYSDIATYTAFNGEDYLTSAIKYVTSESLPVLYALEGHGEKKPDDSLVSALNKAGVELKELNLLSADSIPDDAQCLFIYAPSSDISSGEAAKIKDYLENSGRLMLVTDYNSSELANTSAIMKSYGVSTVDGVVMEGLSDRCLSGYPYYILPQLDSKSIITKPFNDSNSYVLMPLAQAVEKSSDIRDTVKITDLMTASDKAYIIKDESYEKDADAPEGPYALSVAVEEKYDTSDTRIVWITSSEFLSSDTNSMVTGTNNRLFTNAVNYLCDSQNQQTVTGKSIALGTLMVNTSQSRMWKIILTGIIPAIVAVISILVWYRRKNR